MCADSCVSWWVKMGRCEEARVWVVGEETLRWGGSCAKMEERSGSDYEMGIGDGGRSSGGIWSREVTINGAGSKLSGSGSCCGLNQIARNP